jgi:hypothetical protein
MDLAKKMLFSTLGLVLACASAVSAADIRGTVKLGGVIIDEDAGVEDLSDLSVMQETYNIYEGFSVAQIKLNGTLSPKTYFTLSLNDINLDNRKSNLEFWVPGRFKFFGRYDENRQVFDPDRAVNSKRKNLRFGTWVAPVDWVKVSADYDYQTRDGQRLGFPAGTESELGSTYDYVLQTGRIEGEAARGSRAFAVAYDFSDFSDCSSEIRDRFGYVMSARLRTPDYFTNKVTHLLRAAYGKREIRNVDTDYTLMTFQYTGVAVPIRQVQVKYNFFANRTDDKSTRFKTDDFRNNFDATYFYPRGAVFAGYGYEMNDDDRFLTSYHTYRVGGSFRGPRDLTARVEYANRSKKDEEKLTLLKDVEMATFLAKLQASPIDDLVLGAGYKNREREFGDIDVESRGQSAEIYGRYSYGGWGSVGVEYAYSNDEYTNLIDGFVTETSVLTSRADFERVRGLRLGGGVTYLDVGGDLDIEKSIVFVEAEYALRDQYHVEVKYNVYNYDDYILRDRFYTANIVWINVAYDFDFQNR